MKNLAAMTSTKNLDHLPDPLSLKKRTWVLGMQGSLMTSVKAKTRPSRVFVLSIALVGALGPISAPLEGPSAQEPKTSRTAYASKRMEDGKESARRGCQALGDRWRLPTDDEWRQMAKHYGGVSEDSDDKGKAAYKALSAGGSSGFNALLGGGRSDEGQYARKQAHGFYWTASESDTANGWFYNFGLGGQALHRQSGGEKQEAFSVRCVRD